jgi:hypothetical protein
VAFRDRAGWPRCKQRPDHDPGDPRARLVELITSIDRSLSAEAVTGVLRAVVPKASHLQQLAWALQDAPELLAGGGVRAPFPMVLRLVDALSADRRPAWGLHAGQARRVRVGALFSFPLQPVESVLPLSGDRVLVANDNNFPGNDGHPGPTRRHRADRHRRPRSTQVKPI